MGTLYLLKYGIKNVLLFLLSTSVYNFSMLINVPSVGTIL